MDSNPRSSDRASADKAAHKKAVLEERAYHRVAHEAGGAGDEDALHQGRIVARGRPIFLGRRAGAAT